MKFPAIISPEKIHKYVVFLLYTAQDDLVYEQIKECQNKGYTAYYIRVYSNKKSKSATFAPMFLSTNADNPMYLKYTGLKNCLEQIVVNPATEKYIIYFDSKRFVYALKDRNAYHFHLRQTLTIHPSRLTDGLIDIPSKYLNETETLLTFNTVHPTIPIKAVIPDLPTDREYIVFSALGTYEEIMQNELVLKTFLEFVRQNGEYINTTFILVFGGSYSTQYDFVSYNNLKNTFYNSTVYPNVKVYFATEFLSIEIKAVLKEAYMMFDFSSFWDERVLCQKALKYATPLMVGPETTSKSMIVHGENGFVVDIEDFEFNASMMRLCIDDHERLCDNARKYYSKHFSNMSCTLAEFKKEDNRIEIYNDID